MKESLWGYYLVLLGIMVSTVMILMSNMVTTNQQDYYLLKEVTRASMIDSIDFSYYREYQSIRINSDKFVEVFLRRFSESISKTNTYKVDFYSIVENPPSVSIRVTSNTGDYHIAGDTTNVDVINNIDAILESNNVATASQVMYSIPYESCDVSNYISSDYKYCQLSNRAEINIGENSYIQNQIKKTLGKTSLDQSKIKISNIEYLTTLKNEKDLTYYVENYSEMYNRKISNDDIAKELSVDTNFKKSTQQKFANVKNVNITMKKISTDSGDRYYLAYGLNFNCDGVYQIEVKNNACLIGLKYKVYFYYDE